MTDVKGKDTSDQTKPSKVNADGFWKWFNENQQILVREFSDIDAEADQMPGSETFAQVEQVLGRMMDELHKYDDRLFPLCGLTVDGELELIITAEGNIEAFDSAHQLVDGAPISEDWNFMALKPRIDGGDEIEIHTVDGDAGLDIVRYSIIHFEGETILVLVFDVGDDEVEDELAFMGINLVEGILGEQDLATGFDGIDVLSRSDFDSLDENWEVNELSNLAAEFDKRRLH